MNPRTAVTKARRFFEGVYTIPEFIELHRTSANVDVLIKSCRKQIKSLEQELDDWQTRAQKALRGCNYDIGAPIITTLFGRLDKLEHEADNERSRANELTNTWVEFARKSLRSTDLVGGTVFDRFKAHYDQLVMQQKAAHGEREALQDELAKARGELFSARKELAEAIKLRDESLASMNRASGLEIIARHERNEANNKRDDAIANLNRTTIELAAVRQKLEWLTRWRKQSETPCPFPGDEWVIWSKNNETYYHQVKRLDRTDTWLPTPECLKYYEEFKDV